MKISDALSQARQNLDSKGVSNSKLDSLILLTHTFFVLGETISKEQIIFNPDLELDAAKQKVFFELLARRAARQPVSQIIGKREFFGADFLVNSDVLDPRPDSEALIELVLEKFPDKNSQIKILEIGVGSGCLIISLLTQFKNSNAVAADISQKALDVAQKNAANHNVKDRLSFLLSDIFKNIPNLKLDLIISNPPYIPSKEIEHLQDEVKIYEPRSALDGGLDGLDFYRQIAAQAEIFLEKNGKIILEIGMGQEVAIVQIFAKNNSKLEASKKDLSGIERVLCFIKSKHAQSD